MSISSFEFRGSEINAPELQGSKAASQTGSWRAALVRLVQQSLGRIKHERQIRRDIGSLLRFDDRALADIGLSRAEVLHVARYGRLPKYWSEDRAR